MRSIVAGMEPAGEQCDIVVTIRGGADVISQLADACERYGWQLPLAPFVADTNARQVLAVLERTARKSVR
jgi:hypothetical protein